MSIKERKKMIKNRLNEAENIMKGPILGLPESPTRNEILRDIEQSKENLMKKVDEYLILEVQCDDLLLGYPEDLLLRTARIQNGRSGMRKQVH
jgi:hypothetical protein